MTAKVKLDLSGLRNLKSTTKGRPFVRVGVLSDSASRGDDEDDINNAEIGRIHEFGDPEQNIPPRSWLAMPLQQRIDELNKAAVSTQATTALSEGNIENFLDIVGAQAEAVIQGAFKTQGYGQWPANAPSTIKRKGSSQPLIDSGAFRQSITSRSYPNGEET